eukprot:m.6901 g.6901  ORF g.6901 m.6901 type:complete len:406 (+) comp17138_c0_seq1:127-1344(+)
MSRHDGVSCDVCSKGNFRGKRYKCLVCYDYDLCSSCFDSEATSDRHSSDHAMQCILTRVDYEMYYGGEAVSFDHAMSYTCPYCSKVGFSESQLQDHVNVEHGDSSSEVICPVCAAMPHGDANHLTDDFTGHLAMEHRGGRELDEAGMRMRRMLHPGRGLGMGGGMRARRAMHHYLAGSGANSSSNGAGGAGGGSSGAGGPGQNAENVASGSSAAATRVVNASESREMDSIADLLSQLSGSRHSGGSQAAHLQQLQMQLQLERQQVQEHRRQLERLAMSSAAPSRRLAGGGSYSYVQLQPAASSDTKKDKEKEIDLDTENLLAALLPRMTSIDLSEEQLDTSALTQMEKCSFLDNVMLSYLTVKDDNVGDIELSLSSSSGSESGESEDTERENMTSESGKTNLNTL